ncbi:MAG: thioredoxin domain-containing protein [Verrucomicrobia bacterium]|nr:thioredoxin domain-containing protein [Verrucomicrobiota bacterium]
MKTNRLAQEKSPYLLQHQHNPVDWYPWGEEAFEKARREEKPIFLSIGYSTCHWCHVMAHESFENEAIAALLNAHFICIKVDREERPDVDRVYMTFVQSTTGSGGWPLSVFLTPSLVPFLGGTYFPPEDRPGQPPGFPRFLQQIAGAWERERAHIIAHGNQTLAFLREHFQVTPQEGAPPGAECLQAAYEQWAQRFDGERGGFSSAPKFPQASPLHFLFCYYSSHSQTAEGKHAREMALFTLDQMAAGGIHDHLGGGFHRYSVDRFWHVPHFEKMLYDQALLAVAYLHAFQITGTLRYAEVARDTLEYIRRDLTDPGGGFYSAEDADSPVAEDPHHQAEGAFYVWRQAEIEAVLEPHAAALFCRFYGVQPTGNAPQGSDPHEEFAGKNILIQKETVERMAQQLGQSAGQIAHSLAQSRRVLLEKRAQRPRPHRDDKIVTAWNGLALSAFAVAAQVLDDETYLQCAEQAAAFLKTHLWHNGRLRRSYRQGPSAVEGFAADYAFLIQGLLDLYEAGASIAWLQWAAELQRTQDTLFHDAEHGGYWQAAGGEPTALLRIKEDSDGAEPSPNSIAALNALRLGRMLDDTALRTRSETTLRAFSIPLRRAPLALPQMLVALDYARSAPVQIIFAGNFAQTRPLRRELHTHFIPYKTILHAEGGVGQAWLAQHLPLIGTLPAEADAAASLCENFTCQRPVTSTEALKSVLISLKR